MMADVGIGEVILVAETRESTENVFNKFGYFVVSRKVVVVDNTVPPVPSVEGQVPGQMYFLLNQGGI